MTDVNDQSHFSQQAVLRDGTPVVIRALRPGDSGKIVAAFHKLDPQSIYTRFFTFKKELSAEDLRRLGATDFVHSVVLVVTLGAGAEEIVIGGASYSVRAEPDATRVAEVAFTVEEDYQGQGLAGKLLAALAGIACSQGIARFEAEVLATNAPMLSVFQRGGLPMVKTHDDGVVHVVLDLMNSPSSEPGPGQAGRP